MTTDAEVMMKMVKSNAVTPLQMHLLISIQSPDKREASRYLYFASFHAIHEVD